MYIPKRYTCVHDYNWIPKCDRYIRAYELFWRFDAELIASY